MRSRLLLVAVVLVAGCSDRAQTSSPESNVVSLGDAQQSSTLDRLQRDTGERWSVAMHARLGTPTVLAGRSAPLLVAGTTAASATVRFLADYRDLFRMEDPASELSLVREEKDELGMTHARFQQRVGGLRVDGAELLSHFGRDGELTSIRARYVPGLSVIGRDPSLTAARAISLAVADTKAARPALDASKLESASEAELVVLVDDEARASLAYRVHVRGETEVRMEYAIDAHTGAVLQQFDDIETVAGSGIGVLGDTKQLQVTQTANGFALQDSTRTPNGITTYTAATGTTTPGTELTSTTATTWDATGVGKGAAVDAHFFTGVVYDYYKTVHARKGIDGADAAILSTVHFQSNYDNAFWDGTQMVYGDGDGTSFRAFSASVDVIGHELSHGVTQSTSNLQYLNQSGALNEAVSDIFGTFVEHFYKPDPKNNWILGEAISLTGTPIRDMIHPANGRQPSNMSQLVKTTQDNGGVHTNSGIVNNAMYLMTMGGTNDASKIVVSQGLGWDKSAQVWYRAAFHYFGSTTDFPGAATDTMLAATDLQLTQNEKNIVECAWIATGVMTGTCKPLSAPVNADAGAPEAGTSPPSRGEDGGTTPPTPSGTGGTGGGTGGGNSSGGNSATAGGDNPAPSGSSSAAPTQRTHQGLNAAPSTQSGCSVSAPGESGTSAGLLFFASMLGALGLRRRSLKSK